jgi:hypothetical protein
MDRAFLKMTIENLERELSVHAEKFGNNAVHANCVPNFEQAILRLQTELQKLESEPVSEAS